MSNKKQKTKENKEKYVLHRVGGFDLLQQRPILFRNVEVKCLFAISGNLIRSYSLLNGNFLSQYSFANETQIVTLQQKNFNQFFVVHQDGEIITWNVGDNSKKGKVRLSLNRNETVSWFRHLDNTYYYTIPSENGTRHQMYFCEQGCVQKTMIMDQINSINNPVINSIAFCPVDKPRHCFTIDGSTLCLYDIPVAIKPKKKKNKFKHPQDMDFTCIASHPKEITIATGDKLGCIIIWNNFRTDFPMMTKIHWHHHPVNDLSYSNLGSSLYSVGEEQVLVKWNLVGQFWGEKSFLPRLGAPIKYVTTDFETIVVSLEDSTIQIIDSQLNGVQSVIEGSSIGLNSTFEAICGLHYNIRLNAFAMNGRVGHIQMYVPSEQKQLYQLDITNQNVVLGFDLCSLEERAKNIKKLKAVPKIYPIEVTKAAVSDDGNWMATIEYRNDFETLPEIRLKFWHLTKNNNHHLNTTIHLPHQEEVTFITFSPVSDEGELHLVTTSKDKSFKIWDLHEEDRKMWWNCSRCASFNTHSVPSMAAFSVDSSLLTVLFDNTITFWELSSETNSIRYIPRIDTFSMDKQKIVFVGFGTQEFSHYLIEGRVQSLIVRNILNKFEKIFTYNQSIDIDKVDYNDSWVKMAFNPYENIVALASHHSIELVSLKTQKKIMNIEISQKFNGQLIYGMFTPEKPNFDDEKFPLNRSMFYCMNERRELFQLIPEKLIESKSTMVGSVRENTKIYMNNIQSQLSVMLTNNNPSSANQEDCTIFKIVPNYDAKFEQNRKALVNSFFYQVPSHVLPPVDVISKPFLSSLLECLTVNDRQLKE